MLGNRGRKSNSTAKVYIENKMLLGKEQYTSEITFDEQARNQVPCMPVMTEHIGNFKQQVRRHALKNFGSESQHEQHRGIFV